MITNIITLNTTAPVRSGGHDLRTEDHDFFTRKRNPVQNPIAVWGLSFFFELSLLLTVP